MKYHVYIPKHFEENDRAHLLALMRAYNFALLIGDDEDGVPFATHLPVLVREEGDQLMIHAHVAAANRHWRLFTNDPYALIVFQGPHAYVSPTNYVSESRVPTWNYLAVHAYGVVKVIDDAAGKLRILDALIANHEPAFAERFVGFEPGLRDSLVNAIVGLEIAVSAIEGKFKLGQNRLADNRPDMQTRYEQSSDENERALGVWMKKLGYWK